MPNEEQTCGNCGKAGEIGWFICPDCRNPYNKEEGEGEKNVYCSKCGEPGKEGWFICPSCKEICEYVSKPVSKKVSL